MTYTLNTNGKLVYERVKSEYPIEIEPKIRYNWYHLANSLIDQLLNQEDFAYPQDKEIMSMRIPILT